MGANRTQAISVSQFFAGFVLVAAGMASGGSLPLMLPGLTLVGVSFALALKAKPWEHEED